MIGYYFHKIIRKILFAPAIKSSKVHKTARLGIGCNMVNSSLGKYSYVGDYSGISAAEIGAYTSISSNCNIGGGAHPIDWVSTSPVFTDGKSILRVTLFPNHFDTHKVTHIGNDVWIGTHALIKSGIHIADGAIIGMGAVVTKDVGPYEIWAGNPARLIRHRFPEEDREFLQSTQWWTWDEESIRAHANTFHDINAFKAKLAKQENGCLLSSLHNKGL